MAPVSPHEHISKCLSHHRPHDIDKWTRDTPRTFKVQLQSRCSVARRGSASGFTYWSRESVESPVGNAPMVNPAYDKSRYLSMHSTRDTAADSDPHWHAGAVVGNMRQLSSREFGE